MPHLIKVSADFAVETENFINITSKDFKNFSIFSNYADFKEINKFKMDPKFIGKAKLTKQGQLTLPQEARLDLGIEAETEVYWYELNDSLVLVKELVNPRDVLDLVLSKKKRK